MMESSSRAIRSVGCRAFSLIELLTVICIIAMLSTLAVTSLSGISGAGQMNSALAKAAGYIDQVRGFAVANGTFAYVGYRTNDADSSVVDLVAVASASGDDLSATSGITVGDSVNQIGKLLRLSRVMLKSTNLVTQSGSTITVGGKEYKTLAGFGPSGALDFNKSTPRDLQFSLEALNGSTNNIAQVKITGLTGSTRVIRQ